MASNVIYHGGPVIAGGMPVWPFLGTERLVCQLEVQHAAEALLQRCRGSGLYADNGQYTDSSGQAPTGADSEVNVTSHEQMEAATDPEASGWFGPGGLTDEIGNECAGVFGPISDQGAEIYFNGHPYITAKREDNAISGCALTSHNLQGWSHRSEMQSSSGECRPAIHPPQHGRRTLQNRAVCGQPPEQPRNFQVLSRSAAGSAPILEVTLRVRPPCRLTRRIRLTRERCDMGRLR